MMQSGLSRQLFEAWCTDKRNGVLIAGYCVEGTLAKVRKERGKGGERYFSKNLPSVW
jgi:Cft2 family RNA processing exonuclease